VKPEARDELPRRELTEGHAEQSACRGRARMREPTDTRHGPDGPRGRPAKPRGRSRPTTRAAITSRRAPEGGAGTDPDPLSESHFLANDDQALANGMAKRAPERAVVCSRKGSAQLAREPGRAPSRAWP
jgi:hypothetical protein